MPPIEAGQSYKNLADFKDALRQWAIESNFTPHILDSDSHRVRAGCRSSPNCPFRIRANYSAKRGDARVTTVDDVHNCEPFARDAPTHQNIKRAETGKLKFLVQAVPQMMSVTLETSIHDIIAMVEQKYGQKIPIRQAQKVKGSLVTRVKGPCRHCHRMGHTRRICPQLRDSAPGPIDFSNPNGIDFSNNDHGNGDYEDGGMDDTFGEGDTMDFGDGQDQPPNMFHQHSRPQPNAGFDHSSQMGMDPSVNSRVDEPYGAPPLPRPLPKPMSATQIAVQQARQQNIASTANMTPQTQTTQQPTSSLQTPQIPTPDMQTPQIESPQLHRTPSHSDGLHRTPSQSNVMQQSHASTPRTPAEVRREASRLMESAANLLHQAAAMNAEAARLTSSVADAL